MQSNQTARRVLCLFLTTLLFLSPAVPAVQAAGNADVLHIRTVEDLVQLSQTCTLDCWSQGKTVYLDADIDLTGAAFSPIPTFGGVFEGQGHAISGLSITGSGNVRGLFRYIQPSGVVRNLTVEGVVDPSGRKNVLGGLVGENRGILSHCVFRGTVNGMDSTGGLAGINEAEGQILSSAFFGSVTGEHSVGGIAGQNFGSILQCENHGSINTTAVDTQTSLEDLNREQFNAAENAPVCTDIGGIAGFSSGILQSCANDGAVGYAHVGYNVGGIVGRQSGYLNGCANSGRILGRKDVGGIAGQLEPEVRLLYQEDQFDRLLDELDVLQDLLKQTRENLRDSSSQLDAQMDALSGRAEDAQDAIRGLAGSAADWTDGNVEEINNLSARISWLTGETEPILEDAAGLMDLAEQLAGQLNGAMQEARRAGNLGSGAAEELEDALQRLQTAMTHGRASYKRVQAALEHLQHVLGTSEDTAPALEEWLAASQALAEDCAQITASAARALQILWDAGGLEGVTPEEQAALDEALGAIQAGFTQVAASFPAVRAAMARLLGSLVHPEEFAAARQEVQAAGERLASAASSLAQAASHSTDAVRQLIDTLDQADVAGGKLRQAGQTLERLTARAARISRDLSDVAQEWSEFPAITIRPIDQDLRAQGDALGDAFSALLDDGTALREAASQTADTMLDDLDAVSDQFGVIAGLLRETLDGSNEAEPEDRFEDISDQETGDSDTGCLSQAVNTGAVEGDRNVGGIVGAMAIEYDFDLEDDLIREGERSLDFRYQTRAAVTACVNTGGVTGKLDYTGGVVGQMDLGRVSGCENYGAVASTDGDYVGGIAGASWGSIRDCWSQCHLSGEDYIGGVAGLGATIAGCRTLPAIDEGAAYLGAVAGDADRDAVVSGNLFTSDTLGGLDGISYAGAAEPVDFATLCAAPDTPERFTQLNLTFVADGKTVAVVPFSYGSGISALPEIPAKPGYSAAWPELDYAHLTASQTLEAVYTPYASALTDGGALPEILVDGTFSDRAAVTHTSEPVQWTDSNQSVYSGTAYTVTVDDPALEQVSYTVHFRLPDPDQPYTLWILGEDGWSQAEAERDGQYLLIPSQASAITFCVTERASHLLLWALASGLFLAATLVFFRIHRRPRTKAPTQATPA